MSAKLDTKIKVLNVIGTLSYIAALFQWFWVAIIFLPPLMQSSLLQSFFGQTQPESVISSSVTASSAAGTSPFIMFLGTVFAIAVIGAILYVLVGKIPNSIGKAGEVITHTPAVVLTPIVIKHVPLKQKEKRTLPSVFIIIFKIALTTIPFFLLIFAVDISLNISFLIVMLIGSILFAWSFFLLALQLLLAQFLKVPHTSIR